MSFILTYVYNKFMSVRLSTLIIIGSIAFPVLIVFLFIWNPPPSKLTAYSNVRVAAIISDHGFGHAGRMCGPILTLLKLKISVHVVSGVPRDFFNEYFEAHRQDEERFDITYTTLQTDVGMIQKEAVDIDDNATLASLEQFWSSMPVRREKVVNILREWKSDVILFDIGALAPMVAKDLSIPSVALSNFCWDDLYAALHDSRFDAFIKNHRRAYADTNVLLRLPYSMEMSAFDRADTYHVDWIGRRASHSREKTREIVGMREELNYVLVTFGGHSLDLRLERWRVPTHWRVLTVLRGAAAQDADSSVVMSESSRNSNVLFLNLNARRLRDRRVTFVDVLAASDTIVAKTGYGTVSESILHGVPVLYVRFDRFAESDYLVRAWQDNLACEQLHIERIRDAADQRQFHSSVSELFDSADRLRSEQASREAFVARGNEEVAARTLRVGAALNLA